MGRVPEASLVAARAAGSKQGEDTVVLAMSGTLGVTDAFVITSGRNSRQVRTIVDEVERQVKARLPVLAAASRGSGRLRVGADGLRRLRGPRFH